jgi:hypothetical protein
MKTTEQTAPAAAAAPPPKKRLYLVLGAFVVAWLVILAGVPLISASSLSMSVKATLTAVLVIGAPKIALLASIAILGKPGFAYLKTLVFGYMKPPAEVSPARHRVGIVMLVSAIVFSVLEPYLIPFLPSYTEHGRLYSAAGDLMMIGSIFVLGGDFWDKLRALFIRDAKVTFPPRSA